MVDSVNGHIAASNHNCTILCIDENQRKGGGGMSGLPLSAIAMLIFGVTVLYGGLSYFLYRALKARKKQ